MANEWTDEELVTSVDAYKEMLAHQERGEKFSKMDVYRRLAEKFKRTAKSFEYRMQNISAVLAENHRPWIKGLPPAVNVGAGVKRRIEKILLSTGVEDNTRQSYKQKLPAMRDWLIGVARSQGVVTYDDFKLAFETDFFSQNHSLRALGRQSRERGEPIITALIVNDRGHCSEGFEKEFGISDDSAERSKLYAFWRQIPRTESLPAARTPLEKRAITFALAAVRPDQAAFRRAVYIACKGRCVVSGCDIGTVLDAAHRKGRDWRLGHNSGADGYLLRKDLHALYDAGLLKISEHGDVTLDSRITPHYSAFVGASVGTNDGSA